MPKRSAATSGTARVERTPMRETKVKLQKMITTAIAQAMAIIRFFGMPDCDKRMPFLGLLVYRGESNEFYGGDRTNLDATHAIMKCSTVTSDFDNVALNDKGH